MPDVPESQPDPLKAPEADVPLSPGDAAGASPSQSYPLNPYADGDVARASDREDEDDDFDAEAAELAYAQNAEARARTRKVRWMVAIVVLGVLAYDFRVEIRRQMYQWQAVWERTFAGELTEEQKAEIKRLKWTQDPVAKEIQKWHNQLHGLFQARRFQELEVEAERAREGQAKFANGAWKVVEFYKGLACTQKEEAGWFKHDKLHQEWMSALPESATAKIAHAHYLADYAWRARGTGFARTVTEEGRRLFQERLELGRKVLEPLRAAGPVADLGYYPVALRIALGQKKPNKEREAIYLESQAQAPTFWPAQIARAYSLLPRWYGRVGEWEAFAEEVAAQPEGLGDEAYARIVVDLSYFYADGGVFNMTNASWPRTRAGLELLRKRYPHAPEFLSKTALLASIARDHEVARDMFERMGETYHAEVWKHPAYYLRVRNWARTGVWR